MIRGIGIKKVRETSKEIHTTEAKITSEPEPTFAAREPF
jgi:hypothetical protein